MEFYRCQKYNYCKNGIQLSQQRSVICAPPSVPCHLRNLCVLGNIGIQFDLLFWYACKVTGRA